MPGRQTQCRHGGDHSGREDADRPVDDPGRPDHALIGELRRRTPHIGIADELSRLHPDQQHDEDQGHEQLGRPLTVRLGICRSRPGQLHGVHRLRNDGVQVQHVEVAVGLHPVPAAVLVVVGGEEVRPHPQVRLRIGPADVVDHEVALDVDIRIDLVGDLEGEGAQPHGAVVGRAGQPIHAAPAGQDPAGRGVPEAHVVALGGIALDLLLVGEILAAPEEHQGGDRSRRVGAAQQGGDDDAQGGARRDRVGAHPAGCSHRRMDIVLVPVNRQVDGVAQETVRSARATDEVVGHIQPGEDLVNAGDGQIGQHRPEEHRVERQPGVQVPPRADEQPGQPQRGSGGNGEEHRVNDVVQTPAASLDLRDLPGSAGAAVHGRRSRPRPGRHGITHRCQATERSHPRAGRPGARRRGAAPARRVRRRAAPEPGRGQGPRHSRPPGRRSEWNRCRRRPPRSCGWPRSRWTARGRSGHCSRRRRG